MLNNISWTAYLSGAAIVVTLYYLYVGIRYFSGKAKALLAGNYRPRHNLPFSESTLQTVVTENPDKEMIQQQSLEESDEYLQVEQLIGSLKMVIEEASKNNMPSSGLKDNLKRVLDEYPLLKNSPLQASINELVASECEKQGTALLNEKEIGQLW